MTLNVVVLPAPFGPMSPVICPSRADRLTSVTALMPPNFTETSTISRTACGSRRRPRFSVQASVAGADKATLLFHEHGRRGAGDGARGDEGRFRRHADGAADVGAQVGDAAADAVGVAADGDGRDAGEQELVVQ